MTNAQIGFRNLEETKRHNAEQEAIAREQMETSRYVADTSAAASRYAAEQRTAGTMYATDVASSDRAKQLEFDKQNNEYKNNLAAAELAMKQAKTDKEIEKIGYDVRRDLQSLANDARRLGLQEQLNKIEIELKKAQKWESYARTGQVLSKEIRDWVTRAKEKFVINDILKGWD